MYNNDRSGTVKAGNKRSREVKTNKQKTVQVNDHASLFKLGLVRLRHVLSGNNQFGQVMTDKDRS